MKFSKQDNISSFFSRCWASCTHIYCWWWTDTLGVSLHLLCLLQSHLKLPQCCCCRLLLLLAVAVDCCRLLQVAGCCGRWLLQVAGCCCRLLQVASCCGRWLLLVAGCCGLQVAGCRLLLQAIAGCRLLLLPSFCSCRLLYACFLTWVFWPFIFLSYSKLILLKKQLKE